MAKLNLSEMLSEIKNQIENSPADQIVSLLGDISGVKDSDFGALFSPDGLEGLESIARSLGVDYQGKTIELFENKDGGISCFTPAVHSDGKNAILNWGGTTAMLTGRIHGNILGGNEVRVSAGNVTVRLGLRLTFVESAEEKTRREEAILDAENWEDLVPYLRIVAGYKSRKEMFSDGTTAIEVLDVASVEGKTGDTYLSVTGRDAVTGTFKFSLPEDAKVLVGDTIEVDAENKVLKCGAQVFESMGFLKFGELEVGKTYSITDVAPNTGEFPGYTLTIPKIGKVSANTQFTRWYESTVKGQVEIGIDNPIEVTILSVREMKNKNKQCKLALSLPKSKSVGLAALLGKAPAPSSTATASAQKGETAAADDWLTNI